jgi:hypothetical protein
MRIRKVIDRPIRLRSKGINVAGEVTGAISANVNEAGSSRVVSRQKVRVVQTSERSKQATDSGEPTRRTP